MKKETSKVIKALLAIKFANCDVEALCEIVNATPNPDVATEILCGLYEEPIIPEKSILNMYLGNKDRNTECTFESYNKWDTRVTFRYLKIKTRSGYFPKEIDTNIITNDNFNELVVNEKSVPTRYITIETGETYGDTSTCDLEDWLKGAKKVVATQEEIEDIKSKL